MVGAYHFLLSGQDISSQAVAIERILQGKKLPLGVWADVEITSWSKLNRKQLESYLKLAGESFGEELGIYTSQYMWDTSIESPVLGKYKLWIANYHIERPNLPKKGLWENWWLWQFTNKGRIDGVGVNLDLSYFNGTQEDFEKWTGGEAQETNILRIERLKRALEKLCVKLGIDSDSIYQD